VHPVPTTGRLPYGNCSVAVLTVVLALTTVRAVRYIRLRIRILQPRRFEQGAARAMFSGRGYRMHTWAEFELCNMCGPSSTLIMRV
jgi:hypothetical protein